MRDKTALRIPPDVTTAFHSPLRAHVAEHQEPCLAAMAVRDPEVVLCGGLAPGEYGTAQQVRELFRHNGPDDLAEVLDAVSENAAS